MTALAPEMVSSFTFKVLVVGPFGVGKTTLIQQISDVPVVGTEVVTTGDEADVKDTTTVGIEYGIFAVEDDDLQVVLLVFGTPGQDRFSDVRDVAGLGLDGLLVLVDGTAPETWPTAASLLSSFNGDKSVPTVVAINRVRPDEETPTLLLEQLNLDPNIPIVHGDVIDLEDTRRFLVELLAAILNQELDGEEQAAGRIDNNVAL